MTAQVSAHLQRRGTGAAAATVVVGHQAQLLCLACQAACGAAYLATQTFSRPSMLSHSNVVDTRDCAPSTAYTLCGTSPLWTCVDLRTDEANCGAW